MNPTIADVALTAVASLAGGVLASWIAVAFVGTPRRIGVLAFVVVAFLAGGVTLKITAEDPKPPPAPASGNASSESGGVGVVTKVDGSQKKTPPKPVVLDNPDRPVVSVADLVAAASKDPSRPQGGVTEGSQTSVQRFENALAVLGMLNRQWVDGSYGSETVTAVKNFQRNINDKADGVPGILELKSLAARSGTFTARP